MLDAESILARYGLAAELESQPSEPFALAPSAAAAQTAMVEKLTTARAALDILSCLLSEHPERLDLIDAACGSLMDRLAEAGVFLERIRASIECEGEA